MEAIKLKARIGPDAKIEWLEPPPGLPQGEVEVILLYERERRPDGEQLSPSEWPVLNGGGYLGGTLRREEIYDDDGR
jgi:hypothetical protein